MDIDVTRIRVGTVTFGELADAFIPHQLARQIPPRSGFAFELDPNNRPGKLADSVAGHVYIGSGKVVGALLNLPISAVAVVATAGFTLASAAVTAVSIGLGVGGAVVGAVAGSVGALTQRKTSARSGAVTGFMLVSGGLAVPTVFGIRSISGVAARVLGFARDLAARATHATAFVAAGLAGATVSFATLITKPLRAVVAHMPSPTRGIVEPAAVEGPMILASATPEPGRPTAPQPRFAAPVGAVAPRLAAMVPSPRTPASLEI